MKVKSPQAKKKRPEKFKVLHRTAASQALFFASLIDWKPGHKVHPLLISVPKVAGSAVLRNRLKRLIKEWFRKESLNIVPGQSIWIRFNRMKKLKTPIHYKEWSEMLTLELEKLKRLRLH